MDPFIGQIMMFGGNFAPRGWALCDGQLLAISQNTALFSILGTNFGGDGRTTFGLPDMRGRVPIHAGGGPGLTSRSLGEKTGTETNTISQTQLPSHNHEASGTVKCDNDSGDTNNPENNYIAMPGSNIRTPRTVLHDYSNTHNSKMAADSLDITVENTGGNQPVNNVQPVQCVNFIIALQGLYPSRA